MTAGFLAAITVVAFAGAKLPRMGRRRLPGQSNPMSRVAAERENILLGGMVGSTFSFVVPKVQYGVTGGAR